MFIFVHAAITSHIEVYRRPEGQTYLSKETYEQGNAVAPE